jgi:ATP-dependent Clp endopeptidase proteolytic subunit ClpP
VADTDEKEKKENRTPEEIAADIAKAEAEAEQARAEAAKARAEVERIGIDIRSAELALKSQELNLKQTTMSTRIAEIDLERKEEARQDEKAADRYYHTYLFGDDVNETSVARCKKQLTQWQRLEPGCSIEIVFDSPGGSVIDGMHLFDYMQLLRLNGHHIRTVALGYAASMAGILLQAGDERVMGRESYMLIHEIQAGAIGTIGKMEDQMKFLHKIQDRVIDIFLARSGMSKRTFVRGWRRKDWWLTAEEALKLGFCDAILTPPLPHKKGKVVRKGKK